MPPRAIAQQLTSDPILRFFLDSIDPVRPQIRQLTLFGSRARGDSLPDSDYDLLVVVPVKTPQLLDVLYDAVIETLLNYGRLISLKIFTETEYKRLKAIPTPFMRRIQHEGVPLG